MTFNTCALGRILPVFGIGCLCGENDCHEQGERIDVQQLAARIGMRQVKAAERFLESSAQVHCRCEVVVGLGNRILELLGVLDLARVVLAR